jgi:hypothetical protein
LGAPNVRQLAQQLPLAVNRFLKSGEYRGETDLERRYFIWSSERPGADLLWRAHG